MATCKDCLHIEVCAHRYEKLCKGTKVEDLIHACTKFKNRNEYAKVVRCKDCRQWHASPTKGFHYCMYTMMGRVTKPDDFCSYGERREGE